MRTKTLAQIWEQLERIRNYLPDVLSAEQTVRFNRACEICNRYGRNMHTWIKQRLSPAELEEYYQITGVPRDAYLNGK